MNALIIGIQYAVHVQYNYVAWYPVCGTEVVWYMYMVPWYNIVQYSMHVRTCCVDIECWKLSRVLLATAS